MHSFVAAGFTDWKLCNKKTAVDNHNVMAKSVPGQLPVQILEQRKTVSVAKSVPGQLPE